MAERDPKCAMAQWGIAMTWWHPIWTPPTPDEMRAGKAAIETAMSMKAGTERERGFITALNTYYNTPDSSSAAPVGQSCHGPVGPRDRVIAYEKAMRQLRDKYPDDFEVKTFYAFAVLATGYATPNDTSLSKQLEAAGMLEKLWKQEANHPGVVHYLIHAYDYPQLAQRGLTAAQIYDDIAPWVPHALHMPSHIFTRLGMWDESIEANRASAEASRAYAAMRHRDATEAEELHALDYMAYSYLQEARDAEAKKIVDLVAKVRKTNPELEFSAAYALAAIPTRYAFERNDWAAAATLAHPEPATLVFVPFHGSSHRIWTRARTRAHRRPRRRTKSDRTNAAITRRDERAKVRLFQKPSRPADGRRLRRGWQQPKERRTKQSICCGVPRIPKTNSASIPFLPERSFRFANNSALCCWKWDNQRKLSENLRLRSRSIRDDSKVCMERRKLPNRPATMKMQAAITRSLPHKHQKLAAREMN